MMTPQYTNLYLRFHPWLKPNILVELCHICFSLITYEVLLVVMLYINGKDICLSLILAFYIRKLDYQFTRPSSHLVFSSAIWSPTIPIIMPHSTKMIKKEYIIITSNTFCAYWEHSRLVCKILCAVAYSYFPPSLLLDWGIH